MEGAVNHATTNVCPTDATQSRPYLKAHAAAGRGHSRNPQPSTHNPICAFALKDVLPHNPPSPFPNPLTSMLRLLPLGFLALVAFFGAASLHARPDDDSHWQKAYPAAEKGMKRIVIHLDAQKDEFAWKVELIVGKTVETDGVNHVALLGKVEERPVEGWGYTFYRAEIKPGMVSTLIGVDPSKPKVKQFVTLLPYGPVRYNSRLPIVVYVPEGHEVRYRFWKAEETTRTGEEG